MPAEMTRYSTRPGYPAQYADKMQDGDVVALCDAVPRKRLSNCRMLAEEGGEAFGASVMNWLKLERIYASEPDAGDVDPAHREFDMHFEFHEHPSVWKNQVAGPAPLFPASYDGPLRKGHAVIDCILDVGGSLGDCRLVYSAPGDVFGRAVLAWASDPLVRFDTGYKEEFAGRRHIWAVNFRRA